MEDEPFTLVLGSINIDLRVEVDGLVSVGETAMARSLDTGVGGKGANQALSLAWVGQRVRLIGAVGRDEGGHRAVEYLGARGVDVGHVRVVDQPTGTAIIQCLPDGQNAIIVVPGANMSITTDEVRVAMSDGLCGVLIAEFEVDRDLVSVAFRSAHERGIRTVLNPSPALELPDGLADDTDLLVVNEIEAAVYSGQPLDIDDPEPTLRALIERGFDRVVVTMGAAGAAHLERGGEYGAAPARDTLVVDTTGAGDAFLGALVSKWHATGDLHEACLAAVDVAAECVGRVGPLAPEA